MHHLEKFTGDFTLGPGGKYTKKPHEELISLCSDDRLNGNAFMEATLPGHEAAHGTFKAVSSSSPLLWTEPMAFPLTASSERPWIWVCTEDDEDARPAAAKSLGPHPRPFWLLGTLKLIMGSQT
jgi:hypothetical protein